MNTLTRRRLLAGMAAIPVTPVLGKIALAGTPALDWAARRSDDKDFHRAPVLLTGEKEAMLIDGSFNYSAGRALVEDIKATGKQLTTIYISCSDPDYYFSLAPVKQAFPDVKVIAASETISAVNASVKKKIAAWGPMLGANGPQSIEEIVFAQPYDAPTLDFEGSEIEIVTSQTMANRRYLWVPSLQAVLGGVYAFDGLHVWVADTPDSKDRAAWVAELNALLERQPEVVVAGHAAQGTDNGIASLVYTRDYLLSYEEQQQKAADSAELIAVMKSLYPGFGLEQGLEIGAKVVKGEMDWG